MAIQTKILSETEERELSRKGLFIYPMELLETGSPLFLLYSPMARKAMWIETGMIQNLVQEKPQEEQLQEVMKMLVDFIPLKDRTQKVKDVADYPLLTVLPNQKCNLSCSYCYSAKGRTNIELDSATLRNTIDFFIDSKTTDKPLSISYMGGGEPLLSWSLLKESMDYARNKAIDSNRKIDFTIITNGTILTKDILDYIHTNSIRVSISFEIIEEIQNLQRGQYNKVVENIQRLIARGIIPQINSTITPINVERMPEMYRILDTQFPQITHMMFEPVTSATLFSGAGELEKFLRTYTNHFLAIDNEARAKKKSLTSFPYLRTVFPTERACAGEFCLTADGKLSGCYCISTPVDTAYQRAIYGKVSSQDRPKNKIQIDQKAFARLLEENVYNKQKCEECVVKWNCGGGCFHLYNSYPEAYQDAFCNFTKDFVRKVILRRFERLYQNRYNISPQEDMENIKLYPVILEMK